MQNILTACLASFSTKRQKLIIKKADIISKIKIDEGKNCSINQAGSNFDAQKQ